jgi:hypothetical protein
METGVLQAAVDAFDVEYEKRRKPGDDSDLNFPGSSRRAEFSPTARSTYRCSGALGQRPRPRTSVSGRRSVRFLHVARGSVGVRSAPPSLKLS